MVVEYFIKIVIPVVFASFVAMIGWFVGEKPGAMIAGGASLALSFGWTSYSWALSVRQSRINARLAKRKQARAKKTVRRVSCA
ncbi:MULTISPECIES: hypothetical protein [Methylobacillus]|uniref:Uncharacterized protein n=2 Tax=root TaxID=1 RepID=Q1H2P0_METFK|nr:MULTISPECIES: hypothetical protein [Methylobacillus]ABE49103.1 hypothetical protein Mfla_0835 [Methylobacillus flagellatus KT]ABE49247.1 hypothetical protein Mfla_0979 [Methylobacillus flagellatus KT]ABZ07163.1 hypothetical protein ALOHA_HF4000ANIW133B20ctg2g15 [uncultured marine microorganism HF4000_ANIW133B20]MPS49749.1 hypothetical protein [Methylobacillus sp.]